MSDLHWQATELRNLAKHLGMFLQGHRAQMLAADVAERAETLLQEVVRRVPEPTPHGPVSHKSEWD